jgi:hypothetical protein
MVRAETTGSTYKSDCYTADQAPALVPEVVLGLEIGICVSDQLERVAQVIRYDDIPGLKIAMVSKYLLVEVDIGGKNEISRE